MTESVASKTARALQKILAKIGDNVINPAGDNN